MSTRTLIELSTLNWMKIIMIYISHQWRLVIISKNVDEVWYGQHSYKKLLMQYVKRQKISLYDHAITSPVKIKNKDKKLCTAWMQYKKTSAYQQKHDCRYPKVELTEHLNRGQNRRIQMKRKILKHFFKWKFLKN